MKNIAIILFVIYLGLAQGVRFCCQGSYDRNTQNNFGSVKNLTCPDTATFACITETDASNVGLACSTNETDADDEVCDTDGCNCPPGFFTAVPNNNNNVNANNNTSGDPMFGEMRKIMYPIMGVIFGVLWVILAFIGARLPLNILLYAVGFIDAIFGIFLIFIPITTFLGLFYMAIGAFTIAITRHRWGGDTGIDFTLALMTIVFLLTGGLTFVAYDWGQGRNYVDHRMSSYIFACDSDMNIRDTDNGWRSTRCGNYLYFVTFCVYLLFLVQPIGMIAAAFKRVGHHQDTTVVVNEKHTKTENKNTV
jgi:hypothetical protein